MARCLNEAGSALQADDDDDKQTERLMNRFRTKRQS
jgi:hypothetical protein